MLPQSKEVVESRYLHLDMDSVLSKKMICMTYVRNNCLGEKQHAWL